MTRRQDQRPPDYGILLVVVALLGIGLIMVLSASSVEAGVDYDDSYYFFRRQLIWAVIGLGGMILASRLPYWLWRQLAKPILWGALAALMLVLVPGVGTVVNGSRRWIDLGAVSVQPSEIAKLGVVIFLAAYLSISPKRNQDFWRGLAPALGIVGLIVGLIMLEPDLGTTLAIVATSAILLFAGGADLKHLIGLGILGAPAVAWMIFGEEYRRRRFLAFLNPFEDPLGSGYHIIQSLYAIGSGGLFGVGLGAGKQKYLYLPERHTDFIFSIVGEELGFLGGATIVLLFMLLAWRGYRVAVTAPDRFSSLLATGITTMIVLQAGLNIGVVTSTLPITGITLPFISFGGSSLVPTLTGLGILLNISRYCKY